MNRTDDINFDPFSGPELSAVLPLTEAQKEILASTIIDANASLCYNESFSIRIKGKLHIPLLIESIKDLVDRHESLRATISPDGKKFYIYRKFPVEVQRIDAPEYGTEEWKLLLNQTTGILFDLINGSLFKTYLFCHKAEDFTLLLMCHHIICDGWSLDVLLYDLSKIYTAKTQSLEPSLKSASQFSEYVEHLQTLAELREQSAIYWKNLYAGNIPQLELPIDSVRPAIRTYNASRTERKLDENILTAIKALAATSNSSIFTVLLTAWASHLHRLTGQNDIIIGVPFAGQPDPGMNDLVGHCVSLLPVLIHLDSEISFLDQIIRTRNVILDAFENQHLSFGNLLQKLSIQRDPSKVPLICVCFTHTHKYSLNEIQFGDCDTDYFLNPRSAETFEIHLNANESANGIDLLCHYNTSLFQTETIIRHLAGFELLIQHATSNPSCLISDLKIISPQELDLLNSWNNMKIEKTSDTAYVELLTDKLIHNLFETCVVNHPEKTAAICGDEEINYRDLDEKSNIVANYLKSIGMQTGEIVGVSIERSLKMLISVIGILKAGGAYLPLDPVFPEERIKFMCQDVSAKLLITQDSLKERYNSFNTKIILLDSDWSTISQQSSSKPPDIINNQSLAYIIYTSGSTGKPKGVKIHHQSVVNLLLSMKQKPGMNYSDRLLAVTTLSFDMSVVELFVPLITGATVIIAMDNEVMDPQLLARLIEKYNITILQATPATWKIIIGSNWTGKSGLTAYCGGEAINLKFVQDVLSLTDSLWNIYGPTEITVYSNCYHFNGDEQRVLIGKPIDNMRTYILDSNNNIQPIGVKGEVCVGGLGVSKGYHNRDELTREKFIPGPDGRIIYKTGDLGRLLGDGNVELFGRIDNQIKLRGYRIEPGEIENALCRVEGITEAVVKIHKSSDHDDKLIAFIRVADEDQIDAEILRRSLSLALPKYMIPSAFVKLKEFPYTPNGKVDKNALEYKANDTITMRSFIKPDNDIEIAVFDIWSTVLKTDNFGIEDNFFDLGGHSILLAEVQSRIKTVLKKEISIIDLLTHPTIKSITQLISGTGKKQNSENSIQERARLQRKAISTK